MSDERAFRGVWIPADVWLNRDLSMQEKVMLVEIDSLQSPTRGCYKSNKKLAEFFQLSPNRVSEIISSLAKKGWVRIEQIRNGKQIIERRIFMATPFEKPEGGSRDSEGGYSENGENPIRDPEEGYSENREERGSGLRGSVEGNPNTHTAGPDELFDYSQLADDGQPLTGGARQFPMTLDWQPDPEQFAAACLRAGLRSDTQLPAAQLANFTAHHADFPNRRHGSMSWTQKLVDWIRRDLSQSHPKPTGGAHANGRQRTPTRRLTAAEARERDRQQREQPAGGQCFDGEWRSGH
ncbi:DnaT-like ssDNA-binding domain-containing protein [Salinicola sp. LHM]|uniref:DnaT-like ssDNA-binding domain-containing protein n=1 Tax=Salinicola sp. LHM TaxID=3065298 RepID=UPI002ACEC652|nr:DnaT-like ssDNA-binding domain-containing protein [Salinicola sp. LHM]WQH34004.1 DnaT-like ssDNA-binding domain-containing protein [Salinicola sp. LHM]